MTTTKLTKLQKQYLVAELKDAVDTCEVYGMEDMNDYATILWILTESFNAYWNTDMPESVIDEYLVSYFKKELSK